MPYYAPAAAYDALFLTPAEGDAAYDALGAAAAAQAASQPLDADLTAIAALSTTAYGRGFLGLADAVAARALVGVSFPISGANVTPDFGAQDVITTGVAKLGGAAVAATGHVRLPVSASVVAKHTSSGDVPMISVETGGNNVLVGASAAGTAGSVNTRMYGTSNLQFLIGSGEVARFSAAGLSFGSGTPSFGSGTGVVLLKTATAVPSADVTGGTVLYASSALYQRQAGVGAAQQSVNGVRATKALSDANYTALIAEYSANIIEFTGSLTVPRDIIMPAGTSTAVYEWTVYNNTTGVPSAFALTFKVAGQLGVSVAAGKRARLATNGTDVIRLTADA